MLLSQSIVCLGGEPLIYDPDRNAPALRAVRKSVNAGWDNERTLHTFFHQCDVVTYEFENVPNIAIAKFAKDYRILPNPSVLKTAQNRALEKLFLKEAQLPYVNFAVAENFQELEAAAKNDRFPLILKSATGGYDGKFQNFVTSQTDFIKLLVDWKLKSPPPFPIVIEDALDLALELSCITARSEKGEEVAFPVFQNVHVEQILDTTLVPSQIPAELANTIVELAKTAARKLDVIGLLCTEFFIVKGSSNSVTGHSCGDFTIYINEFAPRPHNSGHVTMSACTLSQFDILARILLDIPISEPKLLAPGYFCMANLLGDLWFQPGSNVAGQLDLSKLSNSPEFVDLILYGKHEPRRKRKMGHLITYSPDADRALASAKALRESLVVSGHRFTYDSPAPGTFRK
jgi:5-(carboxyamino)imidazole ribonucleotide synthase